MTEAEYDNTGFFAGIKFLSGGRWRLVSAADFENRSVETINRETVGLSEIERFSRKDERIWGDS